MELGATIFSLMFFLSACIYLYCGTYTFKVNKAEKSVRVVFENTLVEELEVLKEGKIELRNRTIIKVVELKLLYAI